jgi:hypothetical protein
MVCENNPCPAYLPNVGDASPPVGIDGQTSNMNLIATGYSGGRKSRRIRRHRRSHKLHRKSRRGGTLEGGKRRRRSRKSRHQKRH